MLHFCNAFSAIDDDVRWFFSFVLKEIKKYNCGISLKNHGAYVRSAHIATIFSSHIIFRSFSLSHIHIAFALDLVSSRDFVSQKAPLLCGPIYWLWLIYFHWNYPKKNKALHENALAKTCDWLQKRISSTNKTVICNSNNSTKPGNQQ